MKFWTYMPRIFQYRKPPTPQETLYQSIDTMHFGVMNKIHYVYKDYLRTAGLAPPKAKTVEIRSVFEGLSTPTTFLETELSGIQDRLTTLEKKQQNLIEELGRTVDAKPLNPKDNEEVQP